MGCGGSKKSTEDEPSPKPNGKTPPPSKSPSKESAKDNKQLESKPTEFCNTTDRNIEEKPHGNYVANIGSVNGTIKSESPDSKITDKGFKLKVREKLRDATEGESIEQLETAMVRFERSHLEDKGDYSRAKERLQYLTLRRDLRDAVLRSHVGVLEKTIANARNSQFEGRLHKQIEAAERKLADLKELDKYKQELEQTTISEIHSYQRPPSCVHDVMAATYMLLGHPESKLAEWSHIQFLMCTVGRESLMHQVHEFDTQRVSEETVRRVRDMLQQHDIDTVGQASIGAAAFYVWARNICDKIDRDTQKESERLRQEELEEQKKAENEEKSPKKK
ncbi:uncharacterized protein LOC112554554 isoform X1 [Pomacea canaliculata]|uniref:uncharacterized protein LOC112554554 isoform X1 n=1 Tax=Pomacea canaliculata TaxID=400727 RepID=UPI000D7341A6|nr:uncharacterized protein LOC112554554 isoform X1 [Pomacea canaliculata]XP_025078150.1 uncharacterized protein LOC112554554 isoform X1 [Pomacea canaliculata]XP_025078151.1 uncharacterized protein LOC112554554 isoform X1 [Pomacea canaliculata]XP_025078152.1 uncharacterized protein LOC112554554 isoform X1 [Pomacea canaliculata]